MIASFLSQRLIAFFGIAKAILMIGLSANALSADTGAAIDDGWRRTKDGWEHISTWDVNRAHLAHDTIVAIAPSTIWTECELCSLLHPAVIALALFGLGWAGLTWPTRTGPQQVFAADS